MANAHVHCMWTQSQKNRNKEDKQECKPGKYKCKKKRKRGHNTRPIFFKKIAEEVAISNVALTFGENAFPLKLAIVSHTMGAFWCTY
jgi:hypothetical protein